MPFIIKLNYCHCFNTSFSELEEIIRSKIKVSPFFTGFSSFSSSFSWSASFSCHIFWNTQLTLFCSDITRNWLYFEYYFSIFNWMVDTFCLLFENPDQLISKENLFFLQMNHYWNIPNLLFWGGPLLLAPIDRLLDFWL